MLRSVSCYLLVFLACIACAFAADEVVPLPTKWQFRLDPRNVGMTERWQSHEWGKDAARIQVGRGWESQGYAYDGYAWYRIVLDIPEKLRGRQLVVRFGGVDEDAWVFWNGRFAGYHTGWGSAFDIDVSQWVKFGQVNTLVVRVLDTILMGGIWKPVTVTVPEPVQEKPFVTKLRKEGVRLAHLAAKLGTAEAMGKLGCNTVMWQTWTMVNFQKTTPADSDEIIVESDLSSFSAKLQGYAEECKKAGLIDLCTVYGLSEHEAAVLKQHNYRLYVHGGGERGTITPCPLERRYWFGFILPQFLAQAKALKTAGIPGGVIIDLELYGAEWTFPWWDHRGVCYCDECWKSFCLAMKPPEAVQSLPEKDRGRWTREHNLKADYDGFLERRLTAMMKELAAKCREIHPDFIMGMYPVQGVGGASYPCWVHDAILRGWSTPEIPSLAMSEAEFYEGFNRHSQPHIDYLKSKAINSFYVPGLIQGTCMPEDYGRMAEGLARRADGYWLYYSGMFFEPLAAERITPPKEGSEWTLTAPPEEYFRALSAANARLESRSSGCGM